MLAFGFVRVSGSTMTAPAGWTLVRTDDDLTANGVLYLWRRTASSEPASYTFTASGTAAIGIATYRDADVAAALTTAFASGSGTSVVAPSVTVAKSGSMLTVGLGVRNSSTNSSPPASMTERYDQGTSSTASAAWSDEASPPTGASGTRTFPMTVSASWGAYSVVIDPAFTAATLNYWDGTTWTAKPLKRWDGTTWVEVEDVDLKRWDGAAWVQA